MENNKAYNLKTIIIGDIQYDLNSVGKTSILLRFLYDQYEKNLYPSIGCDFPLKRMKINNRDYALQLWDTAGQERFIILHKMFYRQADIVVIVYDVNNPESFEAVAKWKNNFLEFNTYHCTEGVPILVLGNKTDLRTGKSDFPCPDHLMFQDPSITFFEVSAKDGTNIIEAFNSVIPKAFSNKLRKIAHMKEIALINEVLKCDLQPNCC